MDLQQHGSALKSVFGPLRPVFLPERLAGDPLIIGKALLAWDFNLEHAQVDLLSLIAEGLSNDEIAENLHLSQEKGAKNRIQQLYKRLGVKTRSQANAIAASYGLLAVNKG